MCNINPYTKCHKYDNTHVCLGHNPPYVVRLLRVWCCGGVASQILRLLRLIGVWKWFCSHRTGNARPLRPPCLRRTESHAENPTANVLAPCLRGTFNVRSPCHRPCVCTAVCVSVPQWHGAGALKAPLTCVARTDISSLPRVYIAS